MTAPVGWRERLPDSRRPHAAEDLPDDVRDEFRRLCDQARPILALPDEAPTHSVVRRAVEAADVLRNAAGDLYGEAELRPLLSFLSRYPVRPYLEKVDGNVYRGSRPTAPDINTAPVLKALGVRSTPNLCAERPDGDTPYLGQPAVLQTRSVPLVDEAPPSPAHIRAALDYVTAPALQPIYVHCEAGRGRTGVIVACYRVAVCGWTLPDARAEAEHFGCSIPDQIASVETFVGLHRRQPSGT